MGGGGQSPANDWKACKACPDRIAGQRFRRSGVGFHLGQTRIERIEPSGGHFLAQEGDLVASVEQMLAGEEGSDAHPGRESNQQEDEEKSAPEKTSAPGH